MKLIDGPNIMGIINVTPDSFSDHGLYATTEKAIEHADRLIEEGADILDIGGESTRPGSMAVDLEEELRRVIPVIEVLSKKISHFLSILRNLKSCEQRLGLVLASLMM